MNNGELLVTAGTDNLEDVPRTRVSQLHMLSDYRKSLSVKPRAHGQQQKCLDQ